MKVRAQNNLLEALVYVVYHLALLFRAMLVMLVTMVMMVILEMLLIPVSCDIEIWQSY